MKVINNIEKTTTQDERKAYIRFMSNEDNICNCAECPERESGNGCGLPCGQQHCWVSITCGND